MNAPPAAAPFPDVSRAPFCGRAGLAPQQVAEEMVACFRALEPLGDKTASSFRAVLGQLGLDAGDPLARAGLHIAADIDAGTGAGRGNAYHNSQHFCEVLLCGLYLGRLAGLSLREQAVLAFAALVHDFHHDGGLNGAQPFRLERLAVERAGPYLQQARVAWHERERIAALVMATELSAGVPFGRACLQRLRAGEAPPDEVAGGGALRLLRDDAALALQAVVLCEADVLPSVGLTPEYGWLCQERLAREWGGASLGERAKLDFLERHVPGLVAGSFFAPNLERMRGALRASLAGRTAWETVGAAAPTTGRETGREA